MSSLDPLAAALHTELRHDESVVWLGRPDPVVSLLSEWQIAAFGTFWLAICFSGITASFGRGDLMGLLFGTVFTAIGVFMITRPLQIFWQAQRTAFAITDNRLLILTRNGRSLQSILLSAVRNVERVPTSRGTTVRVPTGFVDDGDGKQKMSYIDMRGLRDGDHAYRLLAGC